VTYYTVFVIDVASRRVRILRSMPHPEAPFMQQVRTLTMAEPGAASMPQVLICDRDRKWSRDLRRRLRDTGIRVVLIPERAPNASAHAERFVRSIKEECLDRLIPLGERHFRRAVAEYVEHYPGRTDHQELDNRLIGNKPATDAVGRVRRNQRLGGLLNFYERAALMASAEFWNNTGVSARRVVSVPRSFLLCISAYPIDNWRGQQAKPGCVRGRG
jgi:hypothetical protein